MNRWVLVWTIALGAHAAAAFGLARVVVAPPAAPPEARDDGAQTLYDVEPERAEPEVAPPALAGAEAKGERGEASAPRGALAAKVAPRGGATKGEALAAGEASRGAPNPEPPDAREPRDGSWSFSPTGAVAVDARAAQRPYVVGGAAAGPEGRAPATTSGGSGSPSGGVVEGLEAHDVEIGMVRSGAVLAAAEQAARSENAPLRGVAMLDVAIDASGRVDVRLADASEAAEGWSKVAALLRGSVDPRRVRLPPGARGWHVVLRIEAKVQLADGRDPRRFGTHAEATFGKITETRDEIVIEKLPGVTLVTEGKVCGAAVSIGLGGLSIGGGCSPELVGTGTMRIVSGRIVEEGRL